MVVHVRAGGGITPSLSGGCNYRHELAINYSRKASERTLKIKRENTLFSFLYNSPCRSKKIAGRLLFF